MWVAADTPIIPPDHPLQNPFSLLFTLVAMPVHRARAYTFAVVNAGRGRLCDWGARWVLKLKAPQNGLGAVCAGRCFAGSDLNEFQRVLRIGNLDNWWLVLGLFFYGIASPVNRHTNPPNSRIRSPSHIS